MATAKRTTRQDFRLGRTIRKVRRQKGVTQEQLAEKVGVSTTWIGYLETGYRKPNLKMVYKIAKILGVRVRDIFPF